MSSHTQVNGSGLMPSEARAALGAAQETVKTCMSFDVEVSTVAVSRWWRGFLTSTIIWVCVWFLAALK